MGLLPTSASAEEAGGPPASARVTTAEPRDAVAFLLAPAPPLTTESGPGAAAPATEWDGALGPGILNALFGGYRTILASQDMPVCGFDPSCSRFSQRAVRACGLVEGILLSADRLLRDHPQAPAFYRIDPHTKLLHDAPERYCLGSDE